MCRAKMPTRLEALDLDDRGKPLILQAAGIVANAFVMGEQQHLIRA